MQMNIVLDAMGNRAKPKDFQHIPPQRPTVREGKSKGPKGIKFDSLRA